MKCSCFSKGASDNIAQYWPSQRICGKIAAAQQLATGLRQVMEKGLQLSSPLIVICGKVAAVRQFATGLRQVMNKELLASPCRSLHLLIGSVGDMPSPV